METSRGTSVPKGLLVSACLVAVVWGLWAGRSFFVPVCIAALVASTAAPVVRQLRLRRVPEWAAILAGILALAIPTALGLTITVHELQRIAADIPSLVPEIEALLRKTSQLSWVRAMGLEEQMSVDALVQHLGQQAGHGVEIALGGLRTILEAGTEGALIFGFAVFMLISRRHLRHAFLRILEPVEGVEGAKMLDAVVGLVERFLLAKIVVAVAIGAVSTLGLVVMGYRYALLLGGFAGIGTFLPEVGFLASLVPLVLVGLVGGAGVGKIIAALVWFVVVHLVEANYLTPILVGKRVNLNALATFLGLFAGGLLWGVGGMVLSIPLLAVLRIAMSVSPSLEPWSRLLSERDDSDALERLVGERIGRLWKRKEGPKQS